MIASRSESWVSTPRLKTMIRCACTIPEILHDSVALRKLGFYTRFKEHDKMRLYNT
jgi:hypothetical protein